MRNMVVSVLALGSLLSGTMALHAQDLTPRARPAALVTAAAVPAAAPAAAPVAAASDAAAQPATLIRAAFNAPPARPAALVRSAARASETPRAEPAVVRTTQTVAPHGLKLRTQAAVQTVNALRAAGRRVWCVPFAREASGVQLSGDARTWWGQAAGRYARGSEPKVGAVMNFKPTRGMPRGHVAVVSRILSERMIEIDHANWHRNRLSLGMKVIDISPRNDWSMVRLEHTPGTYSSNYPIYGFISGQAGQSR